MAGSSTAKNGRESQSKRLGVKKYDGEVIIAGNILIRQRGTKYHQGKNTGLGKDHTIFALKDGILKFSEKMGHKVVNVITEK